MAVYGGFNYTSFKGVNLKSTGGVRFEADNNNNGTLSVQSGLDANRQWILPDKTGTIPIMGTFAIQLPAITATNYTQSTIATVTGVRAEDALVVQVNKGVSAGYGEMNAMTSGATARILSTAYPGNGNITLTFVNNGVATGYVELVCSYLDMR